MESLSQKIAEEPLFLKKKEEEEFCNDIIHSNIDDELTKLLGEEYTSLANEANDIIKNKKKNNFIKKMLLPAVLQWTKFQSYRKRCSANKSIKKMLQRAEDYSFKIWVKQNNGRSYTEYCNDSIRIIRADLIFDRSNTNKRLDITYWIQYYFHSDNLIENHTHLANFKEFLNEICRRYNLLSKVGTCGEFHLEIEYIKNSQNCKSADQNLNFNNYLISKHQIVNSTSLLLLPKNIIKVICIDFTENKCLYTGVKWNFGDFKFPE